MSHSKFASDGRKVATLIGQIGTGNLRPDNFHVGESRKISSDLFLHADSEKCRFIPGSKIFEWEHCNRAFRLNDRPRVLVHERRKNDGQDGEG